MAETAKVQTLRNHDTGEAIAPRTVLSAVAGAQEALDAKADKTALNDKADVTALQSGLAGKQDKLTFDTTPKQNSKNPVESGGVYTSLAGKVDTATYTSGLAGKADASALTTGLAGKQDKITLNGILKGNGTSVVLATSGADYATPAQVNALKPAKATATLSKSSWNSNTQTVTATGVLADELAQEIHVMPKASDMQAYMEAGIYCSAQGNNSLTFTCATAPSVDITVYVNAWPLRGG